VDKEKIISMQEYKKKLRSNPENRSLIDVSDIKRATTHAPEQLEWTLLQHTFAKYKLSLNCLFYENHQFKEGLNPNSAFFIGFNSSDLEKIGQEVCNSIKELGKDFILVDAINKPYRRMLKEIGRIPEDPSKPRMMNYEMINVVRQLFYSRDLVVVIKNISESNLGPRKASFAYNLIKILNDAHFDSVHPRTDLVFIDYANFLQRIWEKVGPYLQVTTV